MEAIEIMRKVIEEESLSIKNVEEQLTFNKQEYETTINRILHLKGRLIIMGVGKSGHIGKKIAATFASVGTPSFFVHATEAMHGDLGMITEEDLVMIISNSGETAEAIAPIESIQRIGAQLVALTGNSQSTLAKSSDFILEIRIEHEADDLNLAPTNSSTSVLVIGDSLALTISKLKGFTKEDFGLYHPGGSLGQKLANEKK